jgi:uroporphyrinogen-III synthase
LKVFISRDIDENSLFLKLSELGHTLIAKSLIEIERIPFTAVPASDWIFFYSKNGIHHFFEQLNELRKENLAHLRYGVMGEGSAQYLKKYIGRNPDFVSDTDIEASKRKFELMTQGLRILFVKAADSRASFESFVGSQFKASLIVYSNVCSKSINIPYCNILVFTSPLNAQTYYSTYPYDASQKVISIGKTTTLYLQDKCGVKKVITSHGYDDKHLMACINDASK